MKGRKTGTEKAEKGERQPYQVRIPGFITDDEFGLGDVIKRVTYAVGIKPCGGCERRAAILNRWMVFSGRRPKQRGF
jgi:hypothetical protein